VAAFIPGVPGLGIGRTDHIALGITNSYGDAQDLFIETVDPADPGRYLEGGNSLPFEVITETLKIKDKGEPGGFREENIAIRLTRRGPVVSGVLKGLHADHVMSLRGRLRDDGSPPWVANAFFKPECTGNQGEPARPALIMLNFVFADADGNIGWQTRPPANRARGQGPPAP
jgi:penicillin amidase